MTNLRFLHGKAYLCQISCKNVFSRKEREHNGFVGSPQKAHP